jgi:hypothetical protein
VFGGRSMYILRDIINFEGKHLTRYNGLGDAISKIGISQSINETIQYVGISKVKEINILGVFYNEVSIFIFCKLIVLSRQEYKLFSYIDSVDITKERFVNCSTRYLYDVAGEKYFFLDTTKEDEPYWTVFGLVLQEFNSYNITDNSFSLLLCDENWYTYHLNITKEQFIIFLTKAKILG